jgi:hypothetical protein
VHEEGYQIERDADGALRFSTPNGWPIPEIPAPPAVPPDPMQTIVATNRADGLAIGPRTGCPSWLGQPAGLARLPLHRAAPSGPGKPTETPLAIRFVVDRPGEPA